MAEADWASYLQNEQVRQAANDHATQQYNAAIASGQSEDRALNAGKFAWQKTMDEAGLTGYYQGAPTMGTQQWWANAFGTWDTPTQGQQTLSSLGQQANYLGTYNGEQTQQAQQQAFNQAQALAAMYGTAYTPGGAGPAAGTQTQAAQQQAFTQGLQTQQEARAAQAQQQGQTQDYLKLLASLRGPADWYKYQQVLGSTPGGMRDLYAAAMGQYVPGGGATTGMQPQAVSLQSLMGDVSGNPYYGQGGGQLGTPDVYTGGQGSYGQQQPGMQQYPVQPSQFQAQDQALNARLAQYQQAMQNGGQGSYGQQQPNVSAFTPGALQGQQDQAFSNAQQAYQNNRQQLPPAAGNGTNVYGAQSQNQYNLPAPNQVAAQSWKNLAPSQRELMMGEWEGQGWHKPDVEALMNQALPKYASNASTAGTWRLGQ